MNIRDYLTEEEIGEFRIIERNFSKDEGNLSVGLANIHAIVPGIEKNKAKIVEAAKVLKNKGANIIVFPEFCLAGYFWDDEEACWSYMDEAVTDKHWDWVKDELESLLDTGLQFIIFNNIRKGPKKKYMNSTYIINKKIDYKNPKYIYDKTFLPGIENTYTETGKTDRLVIDTEWGSFGFTTCYDFCFSQLLQEYAAVDNVDAIIQIASWRGSSIRDYPGVNIKTDNYYGYLWDIFMASRSATNQVWVISANAVGIHGINGARFWGGSGVWAPSGMKIVQGSHGNDELLIIHNIDIKGQKEFEKDDFDYSLDFNKIYKQIKGKRSFTRI